MGHGAKTATAQVVAVGVPLLANPSLGLTGGGVLLPSHFLSVSLWRKIFPRRTRAFANLYDFRPMLLFEYGGHFLLYIGEVAAKFLSCLCCPANHTCGSVGFVCPEGYDAKNDSAVCELLPYCSLEDCCTLPGTLRCVGRLPAGIALSQPSDPPRELC